MKRSLIPILLVAVFAVSMTPAPVQAKNIFEKMRETMFTPPPPPPPPPQWHDHPAPPPIRRHVISHPIPPPRYAPPALPPPPYRPLHRYDSNMMVFSIDDPFLARDEVWNLTKLMRIFRDETGKVARVYSGYGTASEWRLQRIHQNGIDGLQSDYIIYVSLSPGRTMVRVQVVGPSWYDGWKQGVIREECPREDLRETIRKILYDTW